jgi:hypothetical protein
VPRIEIETYGRQIRAMIGAQLVGLMLWDQHPDALEILHLWVDEAHPRALLQIMVEFRKSNGPAVVRYEARNDNIEMARLGIMLSAVEISRTYQFDLPCAGQGRPEKQPRPE